jgi:hypothetical protein
MLGKMPVNMAAYFGGPVLCFDNDSVHIIENYHKIWSFYIAIVAIFLLHLAKEKLFLDFSGIMG